MFWTVDTADTKRKEKDIFLVLKRLIIKLGNLISARIKICTQYYALNN